MLRLAVRLFGVVIAVLLCSRSASANGRFPAASEMIFDPHDAKTIYARVTFGLIASRDGGMSWRWICERAVGFSGVEDPQYLVTPKGTLVGSTFTGVALSRDNGCNFSFAQGKGTHVLSDITLRPNGEILGMGSVWAQAGKFANHIVVSSDDAQTFVKTGGPIDPTLLLESIEVAPSEPARIYLTAVRGEGEKRTGALLVSLDGGMSWAERKIDLVRGETGPFIAAVDPKKADRVYVRMAGSADAHTRLLVTDDAGRTWTKAFEAASPILGFALAEDGSRVFAGARDGLSFSATNAFSFTKGSSIDVQCLGLAGPNLLWGCSNERSGFLIGLSRNGGKSFDAKLHIDDIQGPLECPAESSVGKLCAPDWDKLRQELGIPDPGQKPRGGGDPSAPALYGRSERAPRTRSTFAAVAGIGLFAYAAYEILRKIRKRRG